MSQTVSSPFVAAGCEPFGPLSVFTAVQLTQMLADAAMAKHQLITNQSPSVVLYSSGEGARSVTYNRPSLPNLNAYIGELMAALGRGNGRRRGIQVHV